MLTIIHRFLEFGKKLLLLFWQYRGSRLHFILYIFLTAVLSIAIVLAGFRLVTASKSSVTSGLIYHGGDVGLSADQFMKAVRGYGTPVYWLGPMPGSRYELNERMSGIHVVTYLEPSSDLPHLKEIVLVVQTYDDLATHESGVRHFVENKIIVTAGDAVVEYNEYLMNFETITFKNKPEVVDIYYASPQTKETLLKNATRLELIPCVVTC